MTSRSTSSLLGRGPLVGASSRAPHLLERSNLVIYAAIGVALLVAYVLARRGAELAGVLVVAPLAVAFATHRRGNGLLLAVAVLLVVPYWYAHIWLVAPTVAALGLLAGTSHTRIRAVDFAWFAYVVALTVSWILHPELAITAKAFVEGVLPLSFYMFARLTIDRGIALRLQWTLFIVATLAACSVVFEALRGHPVFVDPQIYQWSASATAIFRPGGVFGGSPTAATVLSVILVASLPLYALRPRVAGAFTAIILAAIISTLDRAGLLALVAGIVLFALLLPYRHWARLAMAALALSIPVYVVTSSPSTLNDLSTNTVIQEGVIRTSTLSGRVQLASLAEPLLADSTSHLIFGRGFDALESPGRHDADLVATPGLWISHDGPNDDYLRAILEQGLVGLVPLVLWLGGSVLLGIRTCLRLGRNSVQRTRVAALTAASFGYTLAAIGHDFTHNVLDLAIAALITGMLVSVCAVAGGAPGDGDPCDVRPATT